MRPSLVPTAPRLCVRRPWCLVGRPGRPTALHGALLRAVVWAALGTSLGACASTAGPRPQYAPLPEDPSANVTRPPVAGPLATEGRGTAAGSSGGPAAARARMADSLSRAYAARLNALQQAVDQAAGVLASATADLATVRRTRPGRPTGLLTASALDAALSSETRWQRTLDAATARVSTARSAWDQAVAARDTAIGTRP